MLLKSRQIVNITTTVLYLASIVYLLSFNMLVVNRMNTEFGVRNYTLDQATKNTKRYKNLRYCHKIR